MCVSFFPRLVFNVPFIFDRVVALTGLRLSDDVPLLKIDQVASSCLLYGSLGNSAAATPTIERHSNVTN